MQLAGSRFTEASAIFGNDLATLPSYPAEIRAPAGTVAGVSSFQVHIADSDILTPGDNPDVLVALTREAVKDSGVGGREALRSKNFFALGLMIWMFSRPVEPTLGWIERTLAGDEAVRKADLAAFRADRKSTRLNSSHGYISY